MNKREFLLAAGTFLAASQADFAHAVKDESKDTFNVACHLTQVGREVRAVCDTEEEKIDLTFPEKTPIQKDGLHATVEITRDGIKYKCPGVFEAPAAEGTRDLKQVDAATLKCNPPKAADMLIEIDIRRQIGAVYQEGQFVRSFPVSTGREVALDEDHPATPTPTGLRHVVGKYEVVNVKKFEQERWVRYHVLKWLDLANDYGLHEAPADLDDPTYYTRALRTVGKRPVSHGCIRSLPADADWNFKHIPMKTRVNIFRDDKDSLIAEENKPDQLKGAPRKFDAAPARVASRHPAVSSSKQQRAVPTSTPKYDTSYDKPPSLPSSRYGKNGKRRGKSS